MTIAFLWKNEELNINLIKNGSTYYTLENVIIEPIFKLRFSIPNHSNFKLIDSGLLNYQKKQIEIIFINPPIHFQLHILQARPYF